MLEDIHEQQTVNRGKFYNQLKRFNYFNLIAMMLFAFAFCTVPSLPARAEDAPRVSIDGQEIAFDVPPVIVEGRVLVPLRAIFQGLGYDIGWVDSEQTASGFIGHQAFNIKVGEYFATLDNTTINFDVPAQIIDGRVLVPLRVVAEACLCKVEYDASSNAVNISRGNVQVLGLSLCQGYNSAFSGYGVDSKFSVKSPSIFGVIDLAGGFSQEITFNWYFVNNGTKELLMSNTLPYEMYGGYSILPQDKYRIGDWQLQVVLRNHILQTCNFSINDDPTIYATKDFDIGTYKGYILLGRPTGWGEIKMNNGVFIRGGCGSTNYQVIGEYDTWYDLPFELDLSTISVTKGDWNYPDGTEFSGEYAPYIYASSKTVTDKKDFQYYYYVNGTFTYADNSTKSVRGYYKGFDPTYRFDRIPLLDGTPEEAARAGKVQ
ncbi:MAG TPA: copper amine oxidase N-terminal domain-containing protein [Syntrophomonadaceae bacterium]|nr:copper amine oxidase N-terminal domain-containing protein [Syntrophomonadaceae bacterium]